MFQWHIDKLALGISLRLGFISTLPLTYSGCSRKTFLVKNPLEKETRQNVSWIFCDHYVSIPEIEKQTK